MICKLFFTNKIIDISCKYENTVALYGKIIIYCACFIIGILALIKKIN